MTNYPKPTLEGRDANAVIKSGRYDWLVFTNEEEKNNSISNLKKHWEKRWICYNSHFIYIYKSQKSDYPQQVISLLDEIELEESIFEEKSKKKYICKIHARSTYLEKDTLTKAVHYVYIGDSRDELLDFFEPLLQMKNDDSDDDSEAKSFKVASSSISTTNSSHSLDPHASLGRATLRVRAINSGTIRRNTGKVGNELEKIFPSSAGVRASFNPENLFKYPTLFYSALVGDSNAVVLLMLEANINIDRSSVHPSWIAESYSSNNNSPPSPKKTHFVPRFLQISPTGRVPALSVDSESSFSDTSSVFREICTRFKVADNWYPEDQTKRQKVDDIMNSWGSGKVSHEALQPIFAKIHDSNKTIPSSSYRQSTDAQKLLNRLDSELKNSKYLSGETITIADLLIGCQLLSMKLVNIELGKHPNVKRWQKDLEDDLKHWATIQSEFENARKELQI
eukprot:TRINITY_DN1304_c0_g1_i1.p1 TRINITY_DN1304_c0_g1~~TRINITY_DN1304_c0_g1_i1.p1  ORF type:complete len:451 (+),score=95.46 TRINITY_DN1304_c0_g1_i1:395-1747(+)